MTTTAAKLGQDALALITCARAENTDESELFCLALDRLGPEADESLTEMLARQGKLVAVLAHFSAALIEQLDYVAPGAADRTLQALGIQWAERLAADE